MMCNHPTDFLQNCRGSTNIVIHKKLAKIIDNRFTWLEYDFFNRLAKSISNHVKPLAKSWVGILKIKKFSQQFQKFNSNHAHLLSINLVNLLWMAKFVESLQVCKKIYRKIVHLSLIHIWRCRRIERCRSRWSPYH